MEQKLPSSSEKRKYNDFIKEAEEEMIRDGDYDIGKPQITQLACVDLSLCIYHFDSALYL